MTKKITTLAGDGKAYGSGGDNPHGPKFSFEINSRGCTGRVNFPETFAGAPGLVHNGLLFLSMDDTMFFAALNATDSYSMSVQIKLTVATPARTNEDLLLLGWVDSIDGRKVLTKGEIRRASDQTILANATAMFILVKGKEQASSIEELANISIAN